MPDAGAQVQRYDLTGVVRDAETREPLVGASVYAPDAAVGAATDGRGVFTMRLDEGRHRIVVSFVGYVADTLVVRLDRDREIDVALHPQSVALDHVLVLGDFEEALNPSASITEQTPVSAIRVSDLPVYRIAALLGERDLVRAVQQMPGVKTENDFTGGFYVRGGSGDQNLILLDGVPIYNPWHLFGLFSTFNPEAVGDVVLGKGIFPARYGGRLSSVLDVSLLDGSEADAGGHLNVSVVAAQYAHQIRLGARTTLLIGVRRTYLDPVLWALDASLAEDDVDQTTRYNFTDANVKLTHRLGASHRLDASLFFNDDRLRYSFLREGRPFTFDCAPGECPGGGGDVVETGWTSDETHIGWMNATASVRLLSRLQAWQLLNHAYLTSYRSTNLMRWGSRFRQAPSPHYSAPGFVEEWEEHRFEQRFLDAGYRAEASRSMDFGGRITVGAEFMHHLLRDHTRRMEDVIMPDGLPPPWFVLVDDRDSVRTTAMESAVYLTLEAPIGPITFFPSVRVEHFAPGGYSSVLPRLNVVARPAPRLTVSAGVGRFAQYLHVLGFDKASLPMNRWLYADGDNAPAYATSATVGASYQLAPSQRLSIEGYYRRFDGLRTFSPIARAEAITESAGIPVFSSTTVSGEGEAYGLELFYQKTRGRITGWAGYTLAWSFNQFEDVNRGRRFPTRADRRHDLQFALTYDLTSRWEAGLSFTYQTGQPTTFATQGYQPRRDPLGVNDYGRAHPLIVTEINNYRLPAYHRLDLSLTRRGMRIFSRPAELTLSVFNAYNRFNVFDISVGTTIIPDAEGRIRIEPSNRYVSQLPIIPMFSLRIHTNRAMEDDR